MACLAEPHKPDGWNSPYYFSDPASGKWVLSNPSFNSSHDTVINIQTTFVGPFHKGYSLSGLEINWPANRLLGVGLIFCGSGNFFAQGLIDSRSGGEYSEKISFNRGIFGLTVSSMPLSMCYIGGTAFIVSREYSSHVDNVPAFVGGILGRYKTIFDLGFSGGILSGGMLGQDQRETFAGYQTASRLLRGRLVFSNSGRWQPGESPQFQYILKYWVYKSAATRIGYDPAGWNLGCKILFSTSIKTGELEYYLGEGLYHHINLLFKI